MTKGVGVAVQATSWMPVRAPVTTVMPIGMRLVKLQLRLDAKVGVGGVILGSIHASLRLVMISSPVGGDLKRLLHQEQPSPPTPKLLNLEA